MNPLEKIENALALELMRFWNDSDLPSSRIAKHIGGCPAAVTNFRSRAVRAGLIRLLNWLEASGYSVAIQVKRPKKLSHGDPIKLEIEERPPI